MKEVASAELKLSPLVSIRTWNDVRRGRRFRLQICLQAQLTPRDMPTTDRSHHHILKFVIVV